MLSTTFWFGAIKSELGIAWSNSLVTGCIPLSRVQVNRIFVEVGLRLELD